MSEREASKESVLMSSVQRQAAKRDFLASFKSVLMIPVNVLPGISTGKRPPTQNANLITSVEQSSLAEVDLSRSSSLRLDLPRTELAAKAAIMNSRLEGISSLFSIELA